MSLIPMLFRLHRALYMDHMRLTSDALRAVVSLPRLRISQQEDPELGTTIDKSGFQTCMDLQQFQPNEITVKTVDNTVVVEGKHEERKDNHGFISRHFIRKFSLPRGYDVKNVVSTLSSDGILTIKAPAPKEAIESSERKVNIQQTGPARVTEDPAAETKKEEPKK